MPRETLITASHDVLLRIVAELDSASLRALCLTHTSLVEACQNRLFRTIDTFGTSSDALSVLTRGSTLAKIGECTRRIRFHYSWRVLELNRRLASAAEVDVWLLQHDELFRDLLVGAQVLKVATVVLWAESPYSTAYVNSTLDRLSLTRLASTLAKQTSLTCLKVDFQMARSPARPEQAVRYPVLLMHLLSGRNLDNVEHLSVASLTTSLTPSLVVNWLASFKNLRFLQFDNVAFGSAPDLVNLLPGGLEALEVIDSQLHFDASHLLGTLCQQQVPLKTLRLVALPGCWKVTTASERLLAECVSSLELLVVGNASERPYRGAGLEEDLGKLLSALRAPQLSAIMLEDGVFRDARSMMRAASSNSRCPALRAIYHGVRKGDQAEEEHEQLLRDLRAEYGPKYSFEAVDAKQPWTFAAAFARLR